MGHVVSEIWRRATAAQPMPSAWVVFATGTLALALVLAPMSWRRVRLGITIVHEGGHAVVALLVGRRLRGVRLHADTSGVTVSRGKPTGLGMFVTLLAGYLAPAGIGLGAALLLRGGYALGVLWLAVALMALMLVWIRNVYGFLVLAVGIAIAGSVSWYASAGIQVAAGYLLVWLLLLSAPKPVLELLRAGRSRTSDPDQLARITGVPALAWIVLLLVASLAALGAGALTLVSEIG